MEIEASAVPKTAPGGAGTGLFATSTIKTGQAVFNLPATFSTVLSTERLADACSNCFANAPYAANVMADVGIKLRFCTGCRVVKYCGKVRHAQELQETAVLRDSIGMPNRKLGGHT